MTTLVVGCAGEQGLKGPKGDTGSQGIQGIQGEQGEQGIQGEQGEIGLQGVAGPKGATGAKGATGSAGATGEQGIQGLQGLPGATGATGADGTFPYTMQMGTCPIAADWSLAGHLEVYYDVAFSSTPMVFLSLKNATGSELDNIQNPIIGIVASEVTMTGFELSVVWWGGAIDDLYEVNWLAISR